MRRLAALLLLAACGGSADEGWSGSVETLPNGALRIINPSQGLWQDDTRWSLEPELVIGTVDGAEHGVFSAIVGVEADDDGRVYILDRQANELRIFAPDGAHVRSVGRSGGGPGEYSNANGIRWLTADTLLIVDQRGNRYSILTRDGDFVRSVPRTLSYHGWNFRGGYHDGMVYESTSIGRDDAARPALLGISLRESGAGTVAVDAAAAEAGVGSRQTARVDTVLLPLSGGPMYEAFSVRTERGGMVMSVPHAPRPVYHIDRNGDIWYGRGHEFRIMHSSFAGDTLMEILLEAKPAPVTAEELETWSSSPDVERYRQMGGELDLERIPKVKPYFDDVLVDPEGHIWAFLPTAPGSFGVAIFDPEGRYLGRMDVDGFSRDEFVSPVVRNGRLYVVGRDDLDVQYVRVFRITG